MQQSGLNRSSRRALITSILILSCLFILMCGVIPFDLTLSMTSLRVKIPGDLRRVIQFAEVFAHSLGSWGILGCLLWIDVKNRGKLLRATVFVLICGSLANLAKYMIPRNRPYIYQDAFPSTSWETFGSPFTQSWLDESVRSFPSGHSATAAAMAIGLSYVYPRGRWLFLSLALLATMQRLFSGAHFASDILAGIILTVAIAMAWFWLAQRSPLNRVAAEEKPLDEASS